VYLFFVLSGFVLARAYTPQSAATSGYLLPRLVRLMLPIWGALIVGILVQVLMRLAGQPTGTPWLVDQSVGMSVRLLLRDALIIDGTSMINSSAWSMRYEVLFSLLLPIVLVAAGLLRGRWFYGTGGFLLVLALMYAASDVLTTYLAMFFAGAILARMRLPKIGGMSAALLLMLALALFTSHRTVPAITSSPFGSENWLWFATVTVASCVFIALAIGNETAKRALSARAVLFFGVRSYSIYLIQAPVIVAVAIVLKRLTGGDAAMPWWSVTAFAAALVAGLIFYTLVEVPSHALARRMKVRASLGEVGPNAKGARDRVSGS
jgi:peptidoglycan/LPS O-acetylase OafA/YrhL